MAVPLLGRPMQTISRLMARPGLSFNLSPPATHLAPRPANRPTDRPQEDGSSRESFRTFDRSSCSSLERRRPTS